MKTIIPVTTVQYTMQTTPLHIDDREHCAYIYIDLSTPKHPLEAQEKI